MKQLINKLYEVFNSRFSEQTKHEIFHEQICRSFKKGKIVHTKKLDWEDALNYAEEKAENLMTINDMISFHLTLNDKELYVLFTPITDGGIYISAYDREVNFKKEKQFYVS